MHFVHVCLALGRNAAFESLVFRGTGKEVSVNFCKLFFDVVRVDEKVILLVGSFFVSENRSLLKLIYRKNVAKRKTMLHVILDSVFL